MEIQVIVIFIGDVDGDMFCNVSRDGNGELEDTLLKKSKEDGVGLYNYFSRYLMFRTEDDVVFYLKKML